MKKIIFLLALSFISIGVFSQKKKTSSSSSSVLAKVDNITAQIITDKKAKKLVLFVKNETGVDTLEVKNTIDASFKPENFSLSSFTVENTKLYIVNWNENITTTTKIKHESQDITESQIWNVQTKKMLVGNTQKSIYLKETQYLDKGKTATQDVERRRSEGFEFILSPQGDLILKTKTQENHYKYSKATDKFENAKVVASKSNSSTSKRKR
jgi:hypothetical protein